MKLKIEMKRNLIASLVKSQNGNLIVHIEMLKFDTGQIRTLRFSGQDINQTVVTSKT